MATSAATRATRKRDWRPKFLKRLAKDGDVSASAEAAGLNRATAYKHYHKEPRFKADWDDAIETALDILERELQRRGVDGWDETTYELKDLPVVGEDGTVKPELVPTKSVRKFDTTALLARLNARGKARGYGRQNVEVKLAIEESRADAHRRIDASGLSADQKAAAHAEIDKAAGEGS